MGLGPGLIAPILHNAPDALRDTNAKWGKEQEFPKPISPCDSEKPWLPLRFHFLAPVSTFDRGEPSPGLLLPWRWTSRRRGCVCFEAGQRRDRNQHLRILPDLISHRQQFIFKTAVAQGVIEMRCEFTMNGCAFSVT